MATESGGHGTMTAYRRHLRQGGKPCEECKQANRDRLASAPMVAVKPPKLGAGYRGRPGACDLWPGITAGMDARCSCTLAPLAGVYQVKVRDVCCRNHGGQLEAVLARMERWQQGVS